jgi:hypothetical protein
MMEGFGKIIVGSESGSQKTYGSGATTLPKSIVGVKNDKQ